MRRNLFEAALYMAQRWREWRLDDVHDYAFTASDFPRGSVVRRGESGYELGAEASGEIEAR